MGRHVRIAAVAALLGLVIPLTGTAAAAPQQMADVIVVLHDGVDARATARDMAQSHGARVGHVYEHALTGFAAEVPEGRLAGLERDSRVDFVNENRELHALEYPTGVQRIDGNDAHNLSTSTSTVDGAGVRVAVLDTGIDLGHRDLDANIDTVNDRDCINNDYVADDDQGHGTHVAGTIAAEANGLDVVGVAPKATLLPVKVLGSNGSGSWAQVICGINWITGLNASSGTKVHVANMSLGAAGSFAGMECGSSGDALFEALCTSIGSGTAYVLAAGNDSKDASGFVPAAHPLAITVSAFSDTDGKSGEPTCSGRGLWKTCDETFASFSNYGSTVDLIAPGTSITSTLDGGGTGAKSGTSMAAPHVAGVAALVLQKNSGLSPDKLATHLQDTGQCPDTTINAGIGYCEGQGSWSSDPDSPATEPMVNALAAVTTPVAGGGTPVNAAPTASFTVKCTDLKCDFDGSGSSDSDGTIASYAWDFGDNTAATGITTPHTYASAGTYEVTLTVTDDDGATNSTLQKVTVSTSTSGTTDITLSALGYKVKGAHQVDLDWVGASSTSVEVWEDDQLVVPTTANDGSHIYVPNPTRKGGGTFQYKVCEIKASPACSNTVTVTF